MQNNTIQMDAPEIGGMNLAAMRKELASVKTQEAEMYRDVERAKDAHTAALNAWGVFYERRTKLENALAFAREYPATAAASATQEPATEVA